MSVARTNVPTDERAAGAITPLMRAITHIGFILGGLASVTAETWEEQKATINGDVTAELNEAALHLQNSTLMVASNPYISTYTVASLASVRADITNSQTTDFTDLRDLFETVTNIAHNLAYAAQQIDRDTFGLTAATAGRTL